MTLRLLLVHTEWDIEWAQDPEWAFGDFFSTRGLETLIVQSVAKCLYQLRYAGCSVALHSSSYLLLPVLQFRFETIYSVGFGVFEKNKVANKKPHQRNKKLYCSELYFS